jgi:hypothetical protein
MVVAQLRRGGAPVKKVRVRRVLEQLWHTAMLHDLHKEGGRR